MCECVYKRVSVCTFQPSIKVWVGGHPQARMRQQEAGDLVEAGADVLADLLELWVLLV